MEVEGFEFFAGCPERKLIQRAVAGLLHGGACGGSGDQQAGADAARLSIRFRVPRFEPFQVYTYVYIYIYIYVYVCISIHMYIYIPSLKPV